jgi:hypothetical protein
MPPPSTRRMPTIMTREDDRESDDPPPLTSRDATSGDRDSYAAGKARAAMASASEASKNASEASKNASEALTVSKSIALKIGSSPDPSLGVPGHGLFGVVASLVSDVHGLGVKLDGLAASLAADRAAAALAAESRKGSAAKVVGWIAGPTCALIVGALAAWFAGFHR